MLFAVAGSAGTVWGQRHPGDMRGLIRHDTHARRMGRGQYRDRSDHENSKHGKGTREHGRKIGAALAIVHCRNRGLSGIHSIRREANNIPSGYKLLRKDLRNSVWVGVFLAGAILVIFAAWRHAGTATTGMMSAEVLAEGRQIYAGQCASCHGVGLEGQPDWRSPLPSGRLPAPPHDANGHTWHHPDDVLFRIVKEGTAAIVGGG